jgi:hypothetical protein
LHHKDIEFARLNCRGDVSIQQICKVKPQKQRLPMGQTTKTSHLQVEPQRRCLRTTNLQGQGAKQSNRKDIESARSNHRGDVSEGLICKVKPQRQHLRMIEPQTHCLRMIEPQRRRLHKYIASATPPQKEPFWR